MVTAVNEPGTLGQVATIIGERNGNIAGINMRSRSPDFTELVIDLEVFDLRHLNGIVSNCAGGLWSPASSGSTAEQALILRRQSPINAAPFHGPALGFSAAAV